VSLLPPTRGRATLDQSSDLLPQDPPPAAVRAVGWLLVTIAAAAVTGVIVVQVPETVRSPFVLVPTDGADPIQAPRLAVVASVRVTEGQRVKAGEELFVLRSDEIRSWRTEMTTAASDLQARASTIVKVEADYRDRQEIKKNEIAQGRREIEFRRQSVATKRDLLARTTALAKDALVPKTTLITEQLDFDQAEKELTLSEQRVAAAELEQQRIETEHASWRTSAQSELDKLKARIAALEAPLTDSTQDLLSIRAPYDGVVIDLPQRNAGSVVEAGDELCQIAPAGATPRARIVIREQGLPRLAVGQTVRLFFEAFPYQRYGTVTGTLDWISPAAVEAAAGPSFIGLASPGQMFVLVNREQRPLQVGMKGEARIVVGRRRLIEYAFEPLRQLRENMRR
jgi:multidrug efflux pump subunit AcrA (membrane-fusion protein)